MLGCWLAAAPLPAQYEAVVIVTDTPGKPIAVGKQPAGIAITPDGKTLYVANRRSGTVTVINTRTNAVEKTIKVGKGPWDVLVSP